MFDWVNEISGIGDILVLPFVAIMYLLGWIFGYVGFFLFLPRA